MVGVGPTICVVLAGLPLTLALSLLGWGWSGVGPGHLCCLVGLPLTLALSPEGRGDWIGVDLRSVAQAV